MSWSVNVPDIAEAEFAAAVEAAELPEDHYNNAELIAQWNKQLASAKKAVLEIFDARPFGAGGTYSAYMGGHANHDGADPETGPAGYTTHEFINLNIQRKP